VSRVLLSRITLLALPLALTACEWNSDKPSADAPTSTGDSRRRADAADDGSTAATGHLLLTEVMLSPTGSEFIELTNPTEDPVDLSHYYLADNGNYWKLPAGVPAMPVGDFIVQFPASSMIAAGGVVTLAIGSATVFNAAMGVQPTYSIADSTVTSVNGTTALTDTGEIIVLFEWDGTAGLVHDVDMMLVGSPTAINGIVSKSGMALGSSTYATDANTMMNQSATPGTGVSAKRTMAEDGHETQDSAGNGITGDDETSEDTAMTWGTTFTAATPGQVPTF
jgi:hypothetical protein